MASSHTGTRYHSPGIMAHGFPILRSADPPDHSPRSTTDHFGNPLLVAWEVRDGAGAVIVIIIPVADPLPDIPCHIIDAIGKENRNILIFHLGREAG